MSDTLKHFETTTVCPICKSRMYFYPKQAELYCSTCDKTFSWQTANNDKAFEIGLAGEDEYYGILRKLLAEEPMMPDQASDFPAYTSQLTRGTEKAIRIVWSKRPSRDAVVKLLQEYEKRIGGE